jgi:DNA-binding PadR family transcriptional regulator
VNSLEVAIAIAGAGVAGWVAHHLWNLWSERKQSPAHVGQAAVVHQPLDGRSPASINTGSNVDRNEPPTRAASTSALPVPRETRPSAGLALRVILHLSRLGRLGPDEVAELGSTQRGMSEALGTRQGTLVRVLQGLESAGVLTVDRRHVAGVNHRLKVYRLTSRGEALSRDARRSRKTPLANTNGRTDSAGNGAQNR